MVESPMMGPETFHSGGCFTLHLFYVSVLKMYFHPFRVNSFCASLSLSPDRITIYFSHIFEQDCHWSKASCVFIRSCSQPLLLIYFTQSPSLCASWKWISCSFPIMVKRSRCFWLVFVRSSSLWSIVLLSFCVLFVALLFVLQILVVLSAPQVSSSGWMVQPLGARGCWALGCGASRDPVVWTWPCSSTPSRAVSTPYGS